MVPANINVTSDQPVMISVAATDDDNDAITYRLVDDAVGYRSIDPITGTINATFTASSLSSLRSVVNDALIRFQSFVFLLL